MDISTIIGMIFGSVLIILSILLAEGSDLMGFWSTSSVIVVIGGAIAALMICFPLKTVLGSFGVIKNVIFNKQ
ncbi:MAG: motility protein A, partial [Planctomycetia bacterium]